MAITQTLCSSFKAEVLLGVHDFRVGGDTFKIALYTSDATLSANTTAYSADNEASGGSYVAGGATLTSNGVTTTDGGVSTGAGYVDFTDVDWGGEGVTARGALVYNSTPSASDNAGNTLTNPAVAVLDFGADRTVTGIEFPAAGGTTAIVRIV